MSDHSARSWAYSLPSALVLMAPFDLLASLAMDAYLPVIPEMPAALDTSSATVQLTLTVYMLILGLGQLLFGPLSDRIGRRPVLLGGSLLFSTASFALAMTDSGPGFIILRIVQALGAAASLVATFATVRDVYADRPESSTLYGLFSAMLAFVPALGPILGAFIAFTLGWRAIFVTLGVLGLLAFIQALPRWHETRPARCNARRSGVTRILANASFRAYTLGFSTAMGTFFVFFSTAPRVLIERAGFSRMEFSVAFASVAVVMILVTPLCRPFTSRWGIAGSCVRGLLLMLAGGIVLAVCSRLTEPAFASFLLPMWLVAAGMVMVVSVTANGALQDFADAAGSAVALYYSLQSLLVGGIGTAAVLLLDGRSAWPLVVYCCGMSLVSLLALMTLQNTSGNRSR